MLFNSFFARMSLYSGNYVGAFDTDIYNLFQKSNKASPDWQCLPTNAAVCPLFSDIANIHKLGQRDKPDASCSQHFLLPC